MNRTLSSKLTAALLTLSLLCSAMLFPSAVFAEPATPTAGATQPMADSAPLDTDTPAGAPVTMPATVVPLTATDDCIAKDSKLLNYIDSNQFNEAQHTARRTDLEDLNTYVFDNVNGTRTVYFMPENVKYTDTDGTVREKDLTLIRKTAGYEITGSDIGLLIPHAPADGIDVAYSGYRITLTPQDLSSRTTTATADNAVIYANAFGTGTALKYTPTLSGIKEDILLARYTENAAFTFLLETDGLTLYQDETGHYLAESADSAPLFRLGNVLVYDAIGKPDEGNMTVQSLAPGQRYLLTLSANDAFLSDPDTVYPVVIDPTVEVYGDSNDGNYTIQDAPIFAGRPNTNHGSYTYNRVGTPSASYGVGRTVVRLIGLTNHTVFRTMSPNQISDVKFYVKEASGGPAQYINLYPLTNTTWTENAVTWNNIGSYSTAVNYGATLTDSQWTAFNITGLVKSWKNETYDFNAGFILINENEANNKSFLATEYGATSDRPYVVMTYSEGIQNNLYYSEYDTIKYNDTWVESQDELPDKLICRMNCYGYAFGFILNGSAEINAGGGYHQTPGEFATTENKQNTIPFLGFTTNEAVMSGMISNMQLDADRWGYTITEYIPTTSTVAQFGTSSRLVAAVVGFDSDGYAAFHFYMQHSDGTWSHKPSSGFATNLSLESETPLTNDNIQVFAKEYDYSNGLLKFFITNKPAVIDYVHASHCCDESDWPCNHTQTANYSKEKAGDYWETAKVKGLGSTAGRIDFTKDHDVFRYSPTTSGRYTFTITPASTTANLKYDLRDSAKIRLYMSQTATRTSFTVELKARQWYYIDIYNINETITNYTFTIVKEN